MIGHVREGNSLCTHKECILEEIEGGSHGSDTFVVKAMAKKL
jgi:hypothetical protein